MPESNLQPSKSGIVTDASGQRHIPSSTRADGSTRREIKIRPGYRPPEDVEVYRNRTAQAFRTRGKGGVPGADNSEDQDKPGAPVSNKNAKRREARRKAKADADNEDADGQQGNKRDNGGQLDTNADAAAGLNGQADNLKSLEAAAANLTIDDEEAEKQKKVKRLKKKLREARELLERKEQGEGLLPEQLQKAIRINELVRELAQLGFDANGEPKGD